MEFITQLLRWPRPARKRLRAWPQHSLEHVEVLSPEQFIDLYRTAPGTIKTAQVIPVPLGGSTFGNIVVVREARSKFAER